MTVKELIELLQKEDPNAEVSKTYWENGSGENETDWEVDSPIYDVKYAGKGKVFIS